ncbi:Piso0_000302 [Millerozyma farinosa CBS 7064]|uniref:Piso0_000302 protein n=1 Tax=Pichia sorbitophila (strain ATCC MYA-4447 / BCRC 22081 / CBS 7064 / NBRC 10061 / NRRL Y-12695) TaxID=559304 RepID=G8YTM0_PICSO|nr:Piso0_000302 [Millerozyma farinosa CBS 7064]
MMKKNGHGSLFDTVLKLSVFILKISLIFLTSIVKRILGVDCFSRLYDETKRNEPHNTIIRASNIVDLAAAYGYIVREHVVTTKDEYVLVIHKIEKPGAATNDLSRKKIVYFHHGLLTNSELFLLGDSKEKNLPYLLVERGYEVWLGNNRGNKYSRKHLKLSVSDPEFWDFSLDEFAMYDIPDTIEYISSFHQHKEQITYIGFSQGCSQLFASLSLRPDLNSKLNLFIGLSPAIVPGNLDHPLLKSVVKSSAEDNDFLFFLLGNKAILPSISFWSSLLGMEGYKMVVDKSVKYLFGWAGINISDSQKRIGYPHMFSNSSVKCVMHWFQIINAQRFQMFDETGSYGLTPISTISSASKAKSNCVAPFPVTHHLNVPMFLVHGDQDILVDIDRTKKLITDQNENMKHKLLGVLTCKTYEHMDTLWANSVVDEVFSTLLPLIDSVNKRDVLTDRKLENGTYIKRTF